MKPSGQELLKVRQLSVDFPQKHGNATVLTDIDLEIRPGETLGLVGESGAGKTMIALSLLKLLPIGAQVKKGEILYEGKNLLQMRQSELRSIRGRRIGMVFQDPLASLNPLMRVGQQLVEGMIHHLECSKLEAVERAIELLIEVGIPEPELCMRSYPHQLSGGMRQRALIAAALGCDPRLLICDEITSALDAVTQLHLLGLLSKLKSERNLSILLISHNLSVVLRISDRVSVMREGRILESGSAKDIFETPEHSYTRDLIASCPDLNHVHS